MDPINPPAALNGDGQISNDNPQMAAAIDTSNRIEQILQVEATQITPEERQFLQSNQNLLTPEEIQQVGLGQTTQNIRQSQPQPPQSGSIRTRGIEMPQAVPPVTPPADPKNPPPALPPAGEIPQYVTQMYEQLADIQAETELRGILTTDSGAKTMEPQIREYMKHPAYRQVPVEMIYKMLRPDPTPAPVQQQHQQNVQNVQQSGTPGNTRRNPNGGAPNYSTMSDADLENMANQVKSGVRIPTS